MAKSKAKVEVEVTETGAKMTQKSLDGVAASTNAAAKNSDSLSKSAGTLDRNLKGAAKATSNSTKSFSKMSQGMGGLVGVYASVAAQVFALSATFNFLKRAADVENLRQTQVAFAQNSGIAIQSLTKRLQEASQGMLDFRSAAEASAIGVAKGFSGAQLENLAEGAGKAAAALGRSYDDTFSRLLRGVSKAEPELLDELGITLRLEDATNRYAAALGVSVDSLSTAQRSQAVYNETLRQLNENFGAIEAPVNSFQALQTTFDDLIRTVTSEVLPVFTSIADFINSNAKAAAAAFTALGALILSNITGLTAGVSMAFKILGGSILSTGGLIGTTFAGAGNKVLEFSSKGVDALDRLEKSMTDAGEAAKKIASSLPKASDSKTLQKIMSGENLTGLDKFNIKKAIDSAKKQLEEFGVVSTGIFESISKEALDTFEDSFSKIGSKSTKTGAKIAKGFLKPAVSALKKVRDAARSTAQVVGPVLSRGFNMATTAVKAFGKATVVLAFLQQLSFLFEKLQSQPATLIDGIVKLFANAAKGLQFLGNVWVRFINFLIDKLPSGIKSLFGIEEGQQAIGYFTFADTIEERLNGLRDTILEAAGTSYDTLKRMEDKAQETLKQEEALQEIRENYEAVAKDITNIIKGINGETSKIGKTEKVITGIATLEISELIRNVEAGLPGAQQELDNLLNSFDFSTFGERFSQAVRDRNVEQIQDLEMLALSWRAGMTEIEDAVNNAASTFSSGDPLSTRLMLDGLIETAEATDMAAISLEQAASAAELLNSAFKNGDALAFRQSLLQVEQQRELLADESAALEIDRLKRVASIFQEQNSAEQAAQERSIALDTLKNNLLDERNRLNLALTEQEEEEVNRRIGELERQIGVEQERFNVAMENTQELTRLGQQLGDTISSSFSTALSSVIQGTKSMKEAFADMAKSILKMLADVIAKMLVIRILSAAFGGTSFGDFLGIPGSVPTSTGIEFPNLRRESGYRVTGSNGFDYGDISRTRVDENGNVKLRYGGIMSNGVKTYASGGIASGSTSGYPAMLHGTEAIVPLPNGRSIPVEMSGSSQQNNVTVNVAIDNQGNASTNTEAASTQAGNLGNLIARAVQTELQNQKRSGGILSPYGVA